MQLTSHAKERAAERFPGEDIQLLYCNAKRIGKGKRFKKLKEKCPHASEKYMKKQYAGRYVLITPCNAVFIMEPPETVITVFRLH